MLEKSLSWFYNERNHEKNPMDGIDWTVKNMIFRKVNSGQVVACTLLKFTEAVKRFVASIHAVYLLHGEMIKEPDDISAAPNIEETLSIHKLVRRQNQKREYNLSFFKVANEEEQFHVQWCGDNNQLSCGHEEAGNTDNDCSNCKIAIAIGR